MSGNGPGGLKVGDLYVSVTAAIGEAVKNLSALIKEVEEAADAIEGHMSKAAAALGDFSDSLLSVAAVAAAAFAVATQSSEPARQALDELTGVLRTLGTEVGTLFIPLVQEMTTWVKTAVATWRNLTATQKDGIVAVVKYAAVLGVAGKALVSGLAFTKSLAEGTVVLARVAGPTAQAVSKGFTTMSVSAGQALAKVAELGKKLIELGKADVGKSLKAFDPAKLKAGADSLVATLKGAILAIPAALAAGAASFKAMALAAAPVLATIGAVALAVGSLVVLAAVLRDAWDTSGASIKAWFSEVATSVAAMVQEISSVIGAVFTSLTDFLSRGVEMAFEFLAAQIRWLAKMAAPVAKWVGATDVSKVLDTLSVASSKKMMEYMKAGAGYLWDAGVSATAAAVAKIRATASDVGDSIKQGASGAADILATAKASFDRGMGLLKQDLGFSVELPSFSLPEVGDPNTVQGTKTLEEAKKATETAASFAKGALESVREVTGGLLDAALKTKALMEKSQEWLAANVMGPQFELLVRESLSPAIDAAKKAQQAIVDRTKELAAALAQARDALTQKALGRMGDAPSLVESGIQGAAVAGPLGAVAAVVGDLLTRSEQFRTIVEMVNTVIQKVADVLGRLLGPLMPVVGAVLKVVDVVVSALGPALEALGKALAPIAPLFILLGEMLGPLFQVLGQALEAIVTPISALVEEVMPALFEVFKVVGLVVMNVVLGIREAWNAVVGAIQGVLRGISEFEVLGGRPFEFLGEWADGLEGAKSDTSGLQQAIQNLTSTTYEQAVAAAEQAASSYQAAAALDQMTQSLTNVPSAWKYALRSFEAQDARPPLPTSQPPASVPGSTAGAPTAPTAQPPAAPLVETVNINVQSPAEAMSRLADMLDTAQYRDRGSRGRRGRAQYETVGP